MSTKADRKKVLDRARALGDEFLAAWDGGKVSPNPDAVRAALRGRRGPTGHFVRTIVVRCPKEAHEALKELARTATPEERTEIANASQCIWDYYFMAFYESAARAAGIDHYLVNQSLLPAFAAGCAYIINLHDVIVAVCAPEVKKRDDQLRVHCENGPAIVWGDTKRYFWHGTEVPSEWIEDTASLTPKIALGQRNTELRHAACEIIGWARILELTNARVLDEHPDPQIGRLVVTDLPGSSGARFLLVKCGTGRDFAIPVPREVNTAVEAQCAIYPHLKPEHFEQRQARA
jgi:hypothetical protein